MSDIGETRNLDKTLEEIWKKTKREEKTNMVQENKTRQKERWDENYSKNTRKDE